MAFDKAKEESLRKLQNAVYEFGDDAVRYGKGTILLGAFQASRDRALKAAQDAVYPSTETKQ